MTSTAAAQDGPVPCAQPASGFRPLSPSATLAFDRSACLPVQAPYLSCSDCADVCPERVLHRTADGPVLDDGCLGCGRCVSACPTGALRAAGFGLPERLVAPVFVDCWKVHPEASPAGALRVPCLGGVAVSQWLALAAASEPQGVVALDRGWCGRCTAGSPAAHPAAAALDTARDLLAAVSAAPALLRIELRRLPIRRLPHAIPGEDPAMMLGRRRFLRGLGRQFVATAAAWHDDPAPRVPDQLHAGALRTPERDRRLLWLATLARGRGTALPASLFSTVTIGERCNNHRVCAALCPTGALAGYERDGTGGVAFDAFACIGCGHCERACPEQALRRSPAGTGPAPRRQRIALTGHRARECRGCGARFSAPGDSELCPPCAKSRALVGDLFAQLFPAVTRPGQSHDDSERGG